MQWISSKLFIFCFRLCVVLFTKQGHQAKEKLVLRLLAKDKMYQRDHRVQFLYLYEDEQKELIQEVNEGLKDDRCTDNSTAAKVNVLFSFSYVGWSWITFTNHDWWTSHVSIGGNYLEQRQQTDQIWLVTQRMVCFWRRRVPDKSASECGAGWFALRGGEVALYVKNSVDLQWACSGEKRYHHMIVNNAENPVRFSESGRLFPVPQIWSNYSAGFGKTLTGYGTWTKYSAGFGKPLTGYGIWSLAGCGIWTKCSAVFGKTLTGYGIWAKYSAVFGKTLTGYGIWLLHGIRDLVKIECRIPESGFRIHDLTSIREARFTKI